MHEETCGRVLLQCKRHRGPVKVSAAFPQARHGGSSSQRWSPLNAYIKHGYIISRVVLLHERTDGRTRKRVSAHVLRVILIASRNVNQLLRIFRIVISIYSRAIHVSFLSFFFQTRTSTRNFSIEGEGRKEEETVINLSHAWIDDASLARYVT